MSRRPPPPCGAVRPHRGTRCSAACGDGGDDLDGRRKRDHLHDGERGERGRTAQNVVIEAEDGAFDAHAIYEAASPGVVTVVSVFDASGAPEHLQRRRRRRRGPGLGIRHLRGGRDPHQCPRRDGRGVDRHHRPSAPRGRRDLRPVRRSQPGRGRGRRLRSVLRRRPAQGRTRRARPARPARSAPRTTSRWATAWPRSAVRSARTSRFRSAWSRRPTARSSRSPTSGSTAGSRPTPRSTRATPAARCSTPTARSSASTSRSRLPPGATRASASPFRSTSPSGRSTSFARTAEVSYAYAGVDDSDRSTRSLPSDLTSESTSGALVSRWSPTAPPTRRGCDAGDETITFQGQQVDTGGDLITAVDGEPVLNNADLPRIVSRLNPGDEVTLDIVRDGDEETIDRPSASARRALAPTERSAAL